jgi:hypothetical protein
MKPRRSGSVHHVAAGQRPPQRPCAGGGGRLVRSCRWVGLRSRNRVTLSTVPPSDFVCWLAPVGFPGARCVSLSNSSSSVHPHPKNPRFAPRKDVVDQIAAQITAAGEFDDAHALIVRKNIGGLPWNPLYQRFGCPRPRVSAIRLYTLPPRRWMAATFAPFSGSFRPRSARSGPE